MATKAEMRAEELVYQVADDLGLTDLEQHGLDALKISDAMLVHLRIELKKATGRTLSIEDYLLRDPTKIISLEDAMRRLGERASRRNPAS